MATLYDLDQILARHVMQTRLVTVTKKTPLKEVQRILTESRISGVPVTDESGRILGVLSVRDLMDEVAEGTEEAPEKSSYFEISPEETMDEDFEGYEVSDDFVDSSATAGDIMTPEVHSVPADATLIEVAAKMSKQGIHRVLVEERGKHVGLISTMDVLKGLAGLKPAKGQAAGAGKPPAKKAGKAAAKKAPARKTAAKPAKKAGKGRGR
ncbi:MAG: CBS domain-containing protein [Planctomycetes bacterium]|nr:CBS domain-containing protein [Planctomycetota bacterium]